MRIALKILLCLSGLLSVVTLAAFYVLVYFGDIPRAVISLGLFPVCVALVVLFNSRFLRGRLGL